MLFVSNSPKYLAPAIVFYDFCKEESYQTFPKHHLVRVIFSSFIQVPGEDMSTNPATLMVDFCWFGVGGIPDKSQTTNRKITNLPLIS